MLGFGRKIAYLLSTIRTKPDSSKIRRYHKQAHLISIIIPAYNEKENLARLLPYLCRIGKSLDFEIIVSAGVCEADYQACIDEGHAVTVLKNGRKGRARQMNDGVAIAKGDIYAFLHADVQPPETFFADIERTIASGYDAGFFSYRFDKQSFFLKINASFTKRDGLFTGGGDQCLFIKKAVFEQLNGFDEAQVLMEDFEFFERMKKAGVNYTIVTNDLLVSARKYESNSYLRVNLSNLLLVVLFKLGYAPHKLKKLHNRLLRVDYQNPST